MVQLRPLTSLRFVAALAVFCWHVGWLRTYQTGYVGVSFFFVLSGFILTYAYQGRFTRLRRGPVLGFYRSRLARIYPVYVLAFAWSLFLTPPSMYGGIGPWLGLALANLLLVQSFIPSLAAAFSFDGVAWSLSDEATFYLIFPVVARLVEWARPRLTTGWLLFGAATAWLALVGVLVPLHTGWQSWVIYVFPITRLSDFLAGVVAAIAFAEHPESGGSRWRWSLLEGAALAGAVGVVVAGPFAPQSLRFSALYLPVWGAVVWVFAHQAGCISGLIAHSAAVALGSASFAFYMVHRLVMRSLATVSLYHYGVPWWQDLLVLTAALAIALIVWRRYEEPLRRRLRTATRPPGRRRRTLVALLGRAAQ